MIERLQAESILRKLNPRARSDDISIYLDAYYDYHEASNNISLNGTIVMHPRTGTPIENPYNKIKSSAITIMGKIIRIKNVEGLW